MLIKNPTGTTLTYSFLSLTLTPGEVAEVDNSYIENTEFQLALSAGTLAVTKYEKDYVTNTVSISIGVPVNEPSINQKGAMVTANSPSPLNPFLTQQDYSVDDVVLKYLNTTSVTLEGIKTKSLLVGDERLTFTAPATLDLSSVFAIDASGDSTGSLIPVSTAFYIYVSNSSGLAGAKILRPSVVSPTWHDDGLYLNSSKIWKFMGWSFVNDTYNITSINSVISAMNKVNNCILLNTLTGTQAAVEAATIEVILGTAYTFILPANYKLSMSGLVGVRSSVLSELIELYVGSNLVNNYVITVADTDLLTHINYVYYNTTGFPVLLSTNIGIKGPGTNHSFIKDKLSIEYNISEF